MNSTVTMRLNISGIKDTEISFNYASEGYTTGSVIVPAGGHNSIPLASVDYEDMQVLILEASAYGNITYKVGSAGVRSFPLKNAVLLAGEGMFRCFEIPPVELYFENSGTEAVTITYTFVFDSHLESSSSDSSSASVSSASVSSESSNSSESSVSDSSSSGSSVSTSSDSSSSTSIT